MLRVLVSVLAVSTATWAASASRAAPADTGPLPFHYDLYTFRGDAGRTAVVAAFAVPAGHLEDEDVDGGVRYRFDVSFVLADTAQRSVSRTDDSVFVGFPRSISDEHLLYTNSEIQAPPSRTTLHRVIITDATTPGRGQLYDAAFPIPDYRGRRLMVSDIALGVPGVDAGWRRGDVALALLPTNLFPESAFDVYYEVYNLPAGSPYTTEIFVEPVDRSGAPRGGEEPVRLRFSGDAAPRVDGTLPELRHVETSLGRGHYRITVTIEHEDTGETASRSRVFEVRDWDRDATLVPALSRRGIPAEGES